MWKLDRKCQFGLAWRERLFQLLSLFEIAIGLARRNGAIPSQLFGCIAKQAALLEKIARAIEALGFLGFAGVWRLS